MASNFEIPGLGHLDSNNAFSVSDSKTQSASPETNGVVKSDTVMSDADPITQENTEKMVDKMDSAAENTKDFGANDSSAPSTSDSTRLEAAEDEKMQDAGTLQVTTSDEIQAAAKKPETAQDTEMQAANDLPVQEPVDTKPAPAAPRITDALEAALDGFLGPAPTTSEPENTSQQDQNVPEESVKEAQDQIEKLAPDAPAQGEGDQNPEWEVDSSPYESSSSDSSDDSSDDDESDVEESKLGIEETARLLMEADGGSDDEIDGTRAAKQAAGVRTKNEQPDEPEATPDIKIDPADSIVPLGIVQHVVEGTQAVIEALRDGSAVTVLDRGSVLCKEDRTVLGVIHDTIATVHKPMYVLRFKSEEEAKVAGLQRGMQVWYPKAHAVFVFPSQLRMEKGSDASNLHDEEVAPDEIEYSDDEQEQAHKREKKNRKRGKGKFNKGDDGESRGHNSRKEANIQYDDDDDGPYRPLQRPANFGMGLPPAPPPAVSSYSPGNGSRGGGHHGGWRGEGRGRGGRGRGLNSRGRGSGGHGHHHNNGHSSSPQQPYHNNAHQPPPPFSTNAPPPPAPGQWPFPVPTMPQFTGAPTPQGAPNPTYPAPNWGAAQPNPFPFPIIPPPGWPTNTAGQGLPQQQANYMPPAGGYSAPPPPPPQYPPGGSAPSTSTSSNTYQYSGYYNGGQAPNGQSQQHWG